MYFTGSTEPSRSDHPSPPPPPPPPPAVSVRPLLGDSDVWPTGVALPPTSRVVKRHHRCCPPRYVLALGSTWDCPECGRVWRLSTPFASADMRPTYPKWYRAGWWRSRQHRRRISLGELE